MKKIMEFYIKHGFLIALCGVVLVFFSQVVYALISKTIGSVMLFIAGVNAAILLIFACIDIWGTWRGKL